MDFALKPGDVPCSKRNSLTADEREPKRRKIHNELDDQSQEVYKPLLSWASLPESVLENIYNLSRLRDRHNMSLVCRWWAEQYSVHCKRRTMKINIPDQPYGSLPEITWILKNGKCLKHVEINFECLTDGVKRHMLQFLKILSSHCQLHSFAFRYSGGFCVRKNILDVADAIKNFLKSQIILTSVEFRGFNFGRSEDVEVLRVICEDNQKPLHKLELTKYFIQTSNSDFRFFYESLLNTRILVINYCKTFEIIMNGFAEFIEQKIESGSKPNILLQSIRITCEFDYDLNGIPSHVWLLVKEACPNLVVDICYTPRIDFHTSSVIYFNRYMPLRSLEVLAINTCTLYPDYWSFFFLHLSGCGFADTLQEITVVCRHWANIFVQEFGKFTKSCNKLKKVKISVLNPVPNISRLLDTWVQSKPPALEAAHITVVGVSRAKDRHHFALLAKHYVSILKTLGLRLDLIVDRKT